MAEELNTIFSVVDKSSGPIDKIARRADELSKTTESARKSLRDFSSGIPSALPEGGALPSGRGGGGVNLSEAEQEMFAEDKDEWKTRRMRTRHMKLEMQKERALHQMSSMAMMMFADSHIKAVSSLQKWAMTTQMAGTSFYAMGGAIGAFGGVLTKLGGYGAMLAAGLEIGASVLEFAGVDVHEMGLAAKKYTFGLNEAEKRHEHAVHEMDSLGKFKNVKEREEVAAIIEKAEQERNIARELAEFEIKPASERVVAMERALRMSGKEVGGFTEHTERIAQAQEEFDLELQKAAKALHDATGVGFKEAMEKVKKAGEEHAEAGKHSVPAIIDRNTREMDRSKLGEEIARSELMAVGNSNMTRLEIDNYRKNQAVLLANIEGKSVEEKAALAEIIYSKSADRLDAQEQNYMKQAEQDAILQDVSKKLAKAIHMHVPTIHDSAKYQMAYNAALLNQIGVFALQGKISMAELVNTPEVINKLTGKVRDIQMSQHFHSPRFEIKQAFSEGFDPDRVAVAFKNDLSRIGEHMLEGKHAQAGGIF